MERFAKIIELLVAMFHDSSPGDAPVVLLSRDARIIRNAETPFAVALINPKLRELRVIRGGHTYSVPIDNDELFLTTWLVQLWNSIMEHFVTADITTTGVNPLDSLMALGLELPLDAMQSGLVAVRAQTLSQVAFKRSKLEVEIGWEGTILRFYICGVNGHAVEHLQRWFEGRRVPILDMA